jgi:hypothetical protein
MVYINGLKIFKGALYDSLGRISWYEAWRQYVFSPAFDTLWNKDCLETIQTFLNELMTERKEIKNVIQ